VQTFKKFEKDQMENKLCIALADVAKVPEHIPKVVTCLRTVASFFPTERSLVSRLVHDTLSRISIKTEHDAEYFAKVIASFKPSDVKPLASIHYTTLQRVDAVKVMESVMAKSPELITDDLPRWLADHLFDQNSRYYGGDKVAREQVFGYLTSFATEDALKKALSIVKANEHYKVLSDVYCCDSHDSFPQDLYSKLGDLYRISLIKAVLQSPLPSVLIDLVLEYALVEASHPSISTPERTTQNPRPQCLIQ